MSILVPPESQEATMYRNTLVFSLLVPAVLLTGCGGGDATNTSSDGDHPTASAEATDPSTSAPAAPTGTIEEPTDGTARDGGSGSGAAPDPAAVPEQPSEPGAAVLPVEVVPTQGSQVWAVYLAVADPDDMGGQHMLAETADYVHAFYGYTGSGIGSVSCDLGAAEQLSVDPNHHRVAVYFDSAARAQEFVAVYDREDVGSAPVATYCMD
jgi:hypothetical protein